MPFEIIQKPEPPRPFEPPYYTYFLPENEKWDKKKFDKIAEENIDGDWRIETIYGYYDKYDPPAAVLRGYVKTNSSAYKLAEEEHKRRVIRYEKELAKYNDWLEEHKEDIEAELERRAAEQKAAVVEDRRKAKTKLEKLLKKHKVNLK